MSLNFQNIKISKKTTISIIAVVFFVALDRFFKALCLKGAFDQSVPLVGNFFSLHFVKNNYIAFSLPLSGPILTAIIGLVIIFLIGYFIKLLALSNFSLPIFALVLGAGSNFIDRIRFDYVIDYLDLQWFTIFNIADCLICLGVIGLIALSLKKNRGAAN